MKLVKLRHLWNINPKTRVSKNRKTYLRTAERRKVHEVVGRIDWFGER